MRLALQQSDYFWADLLKQVDWYREQATAEIASVASTPFKRRCTNS